MRPKNNRSARDKQLARERARRQARQQEASYPLYKWQPPFKPYSEWFSVPDAAKNMIEHPARNDASLLLDDDSKELLDTVVKLGPRYQGIVPMAAIYLDMQISEGTMLIAVTGRPGECRELTLAELAESISSPEFLQKMRSEHPGIGLPEEASLVTDDAAAMKVHDLHIAGYLVLDDDNVINLAMPPKSPGGKWRLNGQADPELG